MPAPLPRIFLGALQKARMAEEAIFETMQSRSKDETSTDDKNYSFDNLAEVLGRGLAESMEDASSRERQSIDAMFKNKAEDALSLHRHARHAASRLIGAVEPFSGGFKNDPERESFIQKEGSTFGVTRGFPATLSSPSRAAEEDVPDDAKRSTTPVQLFPGQQSSRRPPIGRDVGLHVDEPQDGDFLLSQMNLQGIVSQRLDRPDNSNTINTSSDAFEIGQGMTSLLNSHSREFKPASSKAYDVSDGLSTLSDPSKTKPNPPLKHFPIPTPPPLERTTYVIPLTAFPAKQ